MKLCVAPPILMSFDSLSAGALGVVAVAGSGAICSPMMSSRRRAVPAGVQVTSVAMGLPLLIASWLTSVGSMIFFSVMAYV